ncbi:hypothetical protein KKH19_00605 [Patescibacteria group bacterium]|nr:hypothetical protein [Patescibacteria group bacterium]
MLYLAKVGEEQILEKVKNDQELKNILISFRRDPKESLDVIKSILEPQYETIREDTRGAIQKLLLEIEKGGDNFPSAEMLGLSQKAVYEATRWILVGRYTFPNITQVFEYLRTNGLLNHRVSLAKKILDVNFL